MISCCLTAPSHYPNQFQQVPVWFHKIPLPSVIKIWMSITALQFYSNLLGARDQWVNPLAVLACIRNVCFPVSAKRTPGKSKEEATLEKKQELEKRLENVKGQLSGSQPKKTPKKGKGHHHVHIYRCYAWKKIWRKCFQSQADLFWLRFEQFDDLQEINDWIGKRRKQVNMKSIG